jgi:hypothetical protein
MVTRYLIRACLALVLGWGALAPAAIAAETGPSALDVVPVSKSVMNKGLSIAALRAKVSRHAMGGLCKGNGNACSGNGPDGYCCSGYCIQGTCNWCVPNTGSGC